MLASPRSAPLAPPDPHPSRPVLLAAALALLAYGANMGSPLYPLYQDRLGFDDLTLTAVYAAYAVAAVPALLLLGPLGDRLGRARLVRAGLLLAASGSVLFAVADHPLWMFAGRVAQGVALGAATGAGMAVLADAPSRGRRGRIAAGGALAFLVGTAAGPGVSGALAALVPAPLVVVHVLHAVAVLAVARALGRDHAPGAAGVPAGADGGAPGGRVRPQLPARGRATFVAATAAGCVSWAVVGLFLGLVPSLLVRDDPGIGVATLGAVASLVVLAALPAQALLPRLGAARAQAVGLALLLAALAVLATTGESTPVTLVLATALLAGCGHGLVYGGAHATVEALAVGPRASGITATAYVVQYAGAGLPTVVVGLLTLGDLSLVDATALCAGVLLGAAAGAAVLVRRAASAVPPGLRRGDGPLSEVADLLAAALRGIHDANGIWHGRRPVDVAPAR